MLTSICCACGSFPCSVAMTVCIKLCGSPEELFKRGSWAGEQLDIIFLCPKQQNNGTSNYLTRDCMYAAKADAHICSWIRAKEKKWDLHDPLCTLHTTPLTDHRKPNQSVQTTAPLWCQQLHKAREWQHARDICGFKWFALLMHLPFPPTDQTLSWMWHI